MGSSALVQSCPFVSFTINNNTDQLSHSLTRPIDVLNTWIFGISLRSISRCFVVAILQLYISTILDQCAEAVHLAPGSGIMSSRISLKYRIQFDNALTSNYTFPYNYYHRVLLANGYCWSNFTGGNLLRYPNCLLLTRHTHIESAAWIWERNSVDETLI
jgi:hypothetical protein